ncbi:MAG: HlyD family efflux transporter periplasmic adaptor subunit [SAR324 cluster bacterium]|nr:HlyD family efflux transporter periplasmic adaptor subunit [SAR324 cluster bacterium]
MPILVLGLGAGITMALLKSKPTARKKTNHQQGTLVEVTTAALSSPQIEVRTHGRIRAAKRVVLSARIGGEVIWISPNLREGRFFKKGEKLLEIGIRQSKSRLKAPFNGVVQTRNVDLGQYVNPGAQLATLLGSDQAEVVIDLPMGRLNWLPQSNDQVSAENQYQILAKISLTGINSTVSRVAVIKRRLLELTSRGMMVQLVAETEDPFLLKRLPNVQKNKNSGVVVVKEKGVADTENKRKLEVSTMPLFVGSFVDVSIPGRQLENVVQIPAQALRDRDTVWIASAGELQVRTVRIAHLDFDNVYLSNGVKPGEKIIISPIKGAANGLKIRVVGEEKIQHNKISGKKRRKGKRPEGMKKPRNKKSEQGNFSEQKEES